MLKDSLLVRSLRKQAVGRTPVWFMRQAGRYLEEYRALRSKHSMLEMIRTPDLAAAVTLQPIERFSMDAAIIFADILNPLIGMGIKLDFVEGEGPKIFTPVREFKDVQNLIVPDVEENVGYTLEAIRKVCSVLSPKGIPLIGFSGAPFTLSWYLAGEAKSKGVRPALALMRSDFKAWNLMQEKLVAMLVGYLAAQARAGASALQIFDSWVGELSPLEFERFVKPHLVVLFSELRKQVDVPLIFFGTGIGGLLPSLEGIDFDALGCDWRLSLPLVSKLTNGRFALQGNLDPQCLFAPGEYLDEQVDSILKEGEAQPGFVFNVGHGLVPGTPVDAVARVVARVKESKRVA